MPYSDPNYFTVGQDTTDNWWNNEIAENMRAIYNAIPARLPVALVYPYAGVTEPEDWFFCNGRAISRIAYSDLFAVIGTTYGAGDGSTTFNLPDLRGVFPLGKDNMGGTGANRVTAAAADTLGAFGGEDRVQLTVAQLPEHSHSVLYKNGDSNNASFGTGGDRANNGGWTTSGSQGGNQEHNNMPPYLTLNYIIKVVS